MTKLVQEMTLAEQYDAAWEMYKGVLRFEDHMHNTKALEKELPAIRKKQLAGEQEITMERTSVSDDAIRADIEENQLARQDADGFKMALFSGRVSIVKPGEGTEDQNKRWIELINNEVQRVIELYPERFIAVAHLPLTATGGIENSVKELHRTADMGFVGAEVIIAPAGYIGPETLTPSDKKYYPLYEAAAERNMTLRMHGSGACNPDVEQTTYTHYLAVDNWAAFDLLSNPKSQVFEDIPDLRIQISHGGGAMFSQFVRARGVAHTNKLRDPRTYLESGNVSIGGTVFGPDSLELLMNDRGIPRKAISLEREIVGAARGCDHENCGHQFDDVLRASMVAALRLGLPTEEFQKMWYDNPLKTWPRAQEIAKEKGIALSYTQEELELKP
jgi:4-oxalmesaconate hydratase